MTQKFFSYAGASLPVFISYLVLTGWAFEIETLKRLSYGPTTINPTSALTFLLAGSSLFLMNAWPSMRPARLAAAAAALSVALIGALRLAGYFFQWETGVDQWLFQSQLAQEAVPSRMTPAGALNFVLMGIALALSPWNIGRKLRLSQMTALAAAGLSLLDLGTSFLFLLLALGILTALPEQKRAEAPAAGKNRHPPLPRSPRKPETILVVDDDESIQKLAFRILTSEGYTVLQAGDPSQALSICREYKNPIHLLLSDSVLPKMPGEKLTELLLALRPEMKVIYISGRAEEETDKHFVQKPFLPDFLRRKIREVLDRPKDLPALP